MNCELYSAELIRLVVPGFPNMYNCEKRMMVSFHLNCLFVICRMWEFSVGLYMITLWPDSLILPAIYGAIECASTALFGPIIGQWVQRSAYFKVWSCLVNNVHPNGEKTNCAL